MHASKPVYTTTQNHIYWTGTDRAPRRGDLVLSGPVPFLTVPRQFTSEPEQNRSGPYKCKRVVILPIEN